MGKPEEMIEECTSSVSTPKKMRNDQHDTNTLNISVIESDSTIGQTPDTSLKHAYAIFLDQSHYLIREKLGCQNGF